jgi:hypothetical protein
MRWGFPCIFSLGAVKNFVNFKTLFATQVFTLLIAGSRTVLKFCIKASGLLPGVIFGLLPKMTPDNNREAFIQNINHGESLQSHSFEVIS